MSKRKSPAEKDALAKEVTRLSNRWLEANRGNPEFQPEHYATKKNPFGDKEKANVAFGKALKKIETDLCKERGLVYSKYEDGEYMLEAPKSLMELYGKGVGGHRGVAHPKTKKQIHDYFQQWYKKNRKSVLKRMEKQRLAGGGPKRKLDFEDDEEIYIKKARTQGFPTNQQVRAFYAGHILPLYQAGNWQQLDGELNTFIDDYEMDPNDPVPMAWQMQDPATALIYGNIIQLIIQSEDIVGQYVAPVNPSNLDPVAMDAIAEGEDDDDDDDLGDIPAAGYSGGANGDSDDEGETDNEMDTDDEDEVNPLALPHFWNGQQWVPVVPNPPPANLMEDDEIIEGNGYYRMSDGCSLYTGGSLKPINYNSELKSNSWLGYGYGRRGHVMPVNHSSELKSSFGTF
jgi:hypothetical protein